MSNTEALVYVVDDDASAREGVARLIRSAGLTPKTFASGEEFLAAPRTRTPGCLVLDVKLPGVSGLDLQRELARSNMPMPIIFLTGHGDIPMTVRAVKDGAVNFLTKPVDDEQLLSAVRQSISYSVEDDVRTDSTFEDIVGTSAALRKVLDQAAIVAATGSTVLLNGETGTGKELLARAIHNLSPRRERSFVRLNCAAIPSGLVESELFGHEKGAFTGALMQKQGRFELADRGTLFLDEIGDISLELQPKLLRALQEHEFERLGSTRTIRVDVRLIAATHRNLQDMIRNNQFREDLFYRLNVFPIQIPPLRERREDIPLLVHYFVSRHSGRMQKQVKRVSMEAMEMLVNSDWPGNIRELENFIERCVIFTRGEELCVPRTEQRHTFVPVPSTFEQAERQIISQALKSASGRIAGKGGAAERLGLKRTTLQNKMRKLNISRVDHTL